MWSNIQNIHRGGGRWDFCWWHLLAKRHLGTQCDHRFQWPDLGFRCSTLRCDLQQSAKIQQLATNMPTGGGWTIPSGRDISVKHPVSFYKSYNFNSCFDFHFCIHCRGESLRGQAVLFIDGVYSGKYLALWANVSAATSKRHVSSCGLRSIQGLHANLRLVLSSFRAGIPVTE